MNSEFNYENYVLFPIILSITGFAVFCHIVLIVVRSFLIVNKNPKYAAKQTNIDINCNNIVLQTNESEFVISLIIPQPINSGKMLLNILIGDSFIVIYIATKCIIIRMTLRNEQEKKRVLNP